MKFEKAELSRLESLRELAYQSESYWGAVKNSWKNSMRSTILRRLF